MFHSTDSAPTRTTATPSGFPKADAIALALAQPDACHYAFGEDGKGWQRSTANSIVRLLQEHAGDAHIVAGVTAKRHDGEPLPKGNAGVWFALASGKAGAPIVAKRAKGAKGAK